KGRNSHALGRAGGRRRRGGRVGLGGERQGGDSRRGVVARSGRVPQGVARRDEAGAAGEVQGAGQAVLRGAGEVILALLLALTGLPEKIEADLEAWDIAGAARGVDEVLQKHP